MEQMENLNLGEKKLLVKTPKVGSKPSSIYFCLHFKFFAFFY